MRINARAKRFDLTPYVRRLVESSVLSALGRFHSRIESVAVHLEAVKGPAQPDTTVCSIVVRLHPSGEVRSLAAHPWMRVAMNRASAEAGAEVEREIRKRQSAAASSPAAGDRLRDRALELAGRQPNLTSAA
jgi:hypothetical protein